MRFRNEQNEIFWRNILKHNLNRYESKVLIAFVTDAPDYSTSITELHKRTRIQRPHISRALKGLCFQNILIKIDGKYRLNENILKAVYEPNETSTAKQRLAIEKQYNTNHGDFAIQAQIKKQKYEANIEGIRKMQKETAAKKKQLDGWQTYYSDIRLSDIFAKVEERENYKIIRFCTGNPSQDRTAIAPMEIAEEFCRKVLKIEDPMEIINYIYSPDVAEFQRKYNLMRPS